MHRVFRVRKEWKQKIDVLLFQREMSEGRGVGGGVSRWGELDAEE